MMCGRCDDSQYNMTAQPLLALYINATKGYDLWNYTCKDQGIDSPSHFKFLDKF